MAQQDIIEKSLIEEIEEDYKKYGHDFMEDIHNAIYNGRCLDRDHRYDLKGYYSCIVGRVRHQNDMPREYCKIFSRDFCYACRRHAIDFWNALQYYNKKLYEDTLVNFKVHMFVKHDVII